MGEEVMKNRKRETVWVGKEREGVRKEGEREREKCESEEIA